MSRQDEDESKYSVIYSIIIDHLLYSKHYSRNLGFIGKQNKHFCHHEAYNLAGGKQQRNIHFFGYFFGYWIVSNVILSKWWKMVVSETQVTKKCFREEGHTY